MRTTKKKTSSENVADNSDPYEALTGGHLQGDTSLSVQWPLFLASFLASF